LHSYRAVRAISSVQKAAKPRKETAMGVAEHGVTNEAKGMGKQVEGKAKEVAGAVTGNLSQELAGKVEKNVGKAQASFGRGEENVSADAHRAVAPAPAHRKDVDE
jgi:uncharacterized protein YjbJ (UPF0337 family)